MKRKTRQLLDEQRQRIDAIQAKWIKPLGLLWWKITIEYDPNRSEYQADDKETVMRTFADWRYMQALIRVNVHCTAEQGDDELEQMFVHELMHVFVNEMRQHGADWQSHEERVAETLSWAFIWLRDAVKRGEV